MYSIYRIDSRLSVIHVFIAIKAFSSYLINNNIKFYEAYIVEVIKNVGAKIYISSQDSDVFIYNLNRWLDGVSFAVFQEGLKCSNLDDFSVVKGNYFAFSEVYASLISKVASDSVNVYVSGSLKSNNKSIKKGTKNRICYISNYRDHDYNINVIDDITYAEFSLVPTYVTVRLLYEYSKKNNIDLVICSKSNREDVNKKRDVLYEKDLMLYEKIIGADPVILQGDSYQIAGESKMVVCDKSTLGYELIGQGCKVVFINMVSYFFHKERYKFGWPLKFEDCGPFWSNRYDHDHINMVLDNVWNMSGQEWDKTILHYRERLMHYDNDNSKLYEFLRSHNVIEKY